MCTHPIQPILVLESQFLETSRLQLLYPRSQAYSLPRCLGKHLRIGLCFGDVCLEHIYLSRCFIDGGGLFRLCAGAPLGVPWASSLNCTQQQKDTKTMMGIRCEIRFPHLPLYRYRHQLHFIATSFLLGHRTWHIGPSHPAVQPCPSLTSPSALSQPAANLQRRATAISSTVTRGTKQTLGSIPKEVT